MFRYSRQRRFVSFLSRSLVRSLNFLSVVIFQLYTKYSKLFYSVSYLNLLLFHNVFYNANESLIIIYIYTFVRVCVCVNDDVSSTLACNMITYMKRKEGKLCVVSARFITHIVTNKKKTNRQMRRL